MTGCIFKRVLRSGRITWGYSIDVEKTAEGKRQQIFKSGFERKSEAAKELRIKLAEKDEGELVKPDPRSFGEFLKHWFAEYAARNCSPKTVERYRQLADYALPYLGHVALNDISALSLERLLNHLQDAGGRDRKTKAPRPLAIKTVRHIAGVLHISFQTAVRWKLLKLNPMDAVQLPKAPKREARALEADQLAWFLDAARAHCPWMWPILLMDAATGCRRGETLALTWPDVDFINRTVKVNKSLEQTIEGLRIKETKNGEPRVISLPGSVVEALRLHRQEQDEPRRLFGPDYRQDLNLVFCTPAGEYLKPDSVTSKACWIAKKAGLKGVSLHTLRHSHGSQLLSKGVPLPTVSKRLGHSSVYVTATVYSHALAQDQITAAEVWDSAIGARLDTAKDAKVS